MDKLEWCRKNAPDALKDCDDSELLSLMSDAYDRFVKEVIVEDTEPVNEINNHMDIMVIALSRIFGDKIAFKGGYMLTKLIPDYARQTTDIDFSIQNSELYEDLIKALEDIGEQFKKRGYIADYKLNRRVEDMHVRGLNMYDAAGSKILGIDVGWHDLSFGTTTTNINVGDVTSFTIERMLSDKITAILSRARFRRSKDIYDLYCITNCFDFDCAVVNDFILKRTEGKGAEWGNFPFNETVIAEYEKAYNKLNVESIYITRKLDKPSFKNVLDRFNTIAYALINDSTKMWSHEKGCFEW